MICVNNGPMRLNGRWFNYTPPPPPPVYYYVYKSANHGIVYADPSYGTSGTEVVLSNTPDYHYVFESYSVTGATLYDGNKVRFTDSDIYVHGNFVDAWALPPYTIRLKFESGFDPTTIEPSYWVKRVDTPDVWDYTYVSSDWSGMFCPTGSHSGYTHTGNIEITSKIIELIDFNCVGITNINGLFDNSGSAQKLGGTIPLFDTSTITSMSHTFEGAKITGIALLNLSNVTDTSYMFGGCSNLTSIPLFDTSSVTNMMGMFDGCESLSTIPLLNTSSVTNMSYMFRDTGNISVPQLNTSSVTDMSYMFYGSDITTCTLFNTTNVTNMESMLHNCSYLTAIPAFNLNSVTDMTNMCAYTVKVADDSGYNLYLRASQLSPLPSHGGTFTACGRDTTAGSAALANIPYAWR